MTTTIAHVGARDARRVLDALLAEVYAQEAKFGEASMRGPKMSDVERLAVLAEEFGEIAHVVCDEMTGDDPTCDLYVELTQLAACCVGWMLRLDAQGAEE